VQQKVSGDMLALRAKLEGTGNKTKKAAAK
jgi:hypothetical protein